MPDKNPKDGTRPSVDGYGGGEWCPVCGKTATGRGYCLSCNIEWTIRDLDHDRD